ncbi:MAG: MoaD/ThiS family protein [Chloroflexi bacterium]|nr:MoaD/ThiS family protein [Chloroflexota bacterium]
MSVEVQVPTVLRSHTGGERVVHAEGNTVAAVIEALEHEFPGFRTELLGDDGNLRTFVNLYVNDEDIRYLNRLDTPLADGDRLAILPALAGGGSSTPGGFPPD